MIEYYLKLSTWAGYDPVARHHYASVRWQDKNDDYQYERLEKEVRDECIFCKGKKCEYCDNKGWVPDKTERFDSESEALRAGIAWFEKRKDGILYLGDSAYMEPHHILAGMPEKKRKKANELCARAEKHWRRYGTQGKKYEEMYAEWKKIVYGNKKPRR